MTDAQSPSTSHVSPALLRDLSLVLPGVDTVCDAPVKAFIKGRAVEIDDAIHETVRLIRANRAPAVVGLSGLSIEAARHAVALAELSRCRLLPRPAPNPTLARSPIVQSASLGHVLACEAAVLVGDVACAGPIVQTVRERVNNIVETNDSLSTPRITRTDEKHPVAQLLRNHARVAALLSPQCDFRVIEQWHQLAGHVQRQCRLAVVSLPALSIAGNLRGVIEVITWQTGLSCASGGIDFATGGPRPCTDFPTLQSRGAIDLLIDTSLKPVSQKNDAPRIVFNAQPDPQAQVCFVTPGLVAGLAARVMRFDGVILWLCDDPSPNGGAPPDPTAELLAQIAMRITGEN